MDPLENQRRKSYLALSEADGDNVRRFREVFRQHAVTFADRFYEHLRSSPQTAPFIGDPSVLERLKRLQAEYFAELLEGVYDEDYIRKRLTIGHTHQRVGIEPVVYLGAYNQYIQLTFPLFVEAFGSHVGEVLPGLLSLVKVIFFDISLALETYFQDATEQLRRRNEELQQALLLVQRAQQREEQLRRLLSHEVRGGLAAIITSLEDLLDSAGLEGEPRGELDRTLRRTWTLSEMLGEMLQNTRECGPTRVDTYALFQSLRSRFQLYATGREIELILPRYPPAVWADPLQLREVFANLMANAVRYLDKPKGYVEVIAREFVAQDTPEGMDHPEGCFVLFGVRDNGPGLPEAICGRLFEPFVRAAGYLGPRAGTGLGLYFVRTIIEQGGGRIWYETQTGEGTCFWFTVPGSPAERLGNGSPSGSEAHHG